MSRRFESSAQALSKVCESIFLVVPAKAGAQRLQRIADELRISISWTPACAGATDFAEALKPKRARNEYRLYLPPRLFSA